MTGLFRETQCVDCVSTIQEQIKGRRRLRCDTCRTARLKVSDRRNKERNREQRLAARRVFNQRPEVKAARAEWKRRPEVKAKEVIRRRRPEVQARTKERERAYRATGRRTDLKHARRARMNGVSDGAARYARNKLRKAQGNRCAFCKASLYRKMAHLDHIVALVNGGTHEDSNLQVLCAHCNLSKGARDPVEFAQANGRLM